MKNKKRGRPFGSFKGSFSHISHPLYNKWCAMRYRCENPNMPNWKNYGGRGIRVCERWLDKRTGFENFLTDMGQRPTEKHTIELINNDEHYEPSNCRWATMAEQALNRRPEKVNPESIYGKAKLAGLPYHIVYMRIKKFSWPESKALSTPIQKRGRKLGWRKNPGLAALMAGSVSVQP